MEMKRKPSIVFYMHENKTFFVVQGSLIYLWFNSCFIQWTIVLYHSFIENKRVMDATVMNSVLSLFYNQSCDRILLLKISKFMTMVQVSPRKPKGTHHGVRMSLSKSPWNDMSTRINVKINGLKMNGFLCVSVFFGLWSTVFSRVMNSQPFHNEWLVRVLTTGFGWAYVITVGTTSVWRWVSRLSVWKWMASSLSRLYVQRLFSNQIKIGVGHNGVGSEITNQIRNKKNKMQGFSSSIFIKQKRT